LCATLSACATYAPTPLPGRPDLADDLDRLTVTPAEMPLPELGTHRFDPSRPLDMDEVAMVAVVNNPDLKARRDRIGVAGAQAFAAGLLPNPMLTLDRGFLFAGPGTMDALTLGLAQDIVPLLNLATRKTAAAAAAQSASLDLLWQEWQVVSQARLLFVRAVELDKQRAVLETNRALFADRYEHSSKAMARGNETLPTVVSDLTALKAVETQIYDLDQQILRNRHDLNALLGLSPDLDLRLAGEAGVPAIDAARLRSILPDLASRRPDLLALRAGYDAQEAKVRQAIIEQFPTLTIGSNRARDTSGVYTQSLSINVGLPIFNQNQGNIAIERATRQQLRNEYQAQLDAAYTAVGRLITEQQQLEEQYRSSLASVEQLRSAADTAERVYRAGNLDERSYVDLRAALLAKQNETIKLEQTILEQRVTLQTLIGSNLPTLTAPTPGAGR